MSDLIEVGFRTIHYKTWGFQWSKEFWNWEDIDWGAWKIVDRTWEIGYDKAKQRLSPKWNEKAQGDSFPRVWISPSPAWIMLQLERI